MSGKKPDPKKTKVFGMVHRVAAAIMKRRREALQEVRQECGSLVGDIDPDAVDRDSKDYLFGACEALFHLASACEIREVDSHIIELLMHDDDCWQILNDSVLCKTFVCTIRNGRALISLLNEGLIQQEVEGYEPTEWGVLAWRHVLPDRMLAGK